MTFQKDTVTYELIQEKKRNGELVYIDMYTRAINEKLKEGAASFHQVEELFEDLHIQRLTVRESTNHYYKDIAAYQRAITSIIRYAPTPAFSRKYATFLFSEVVKPFRTPRVELTAFTNLVYVYGAEGSPESMEEALDIIKLALEVGVYEIEPDHYKDTTGRMIRMRDPLEVFESVCRKVLRYHELVFAPDKSCLVPFKR